MYARYLFLIAPLLALMGCGAAAPVFVTEPAVSANPNPSAPLAAVLTFTTDQPVTTAVHISDGDNEWTLRYDAGRDPGASLPIVGMRPDRKHDIHVSITDADGDTTDAEQILEYTTPPLPTELGEFPPINVTISEPENMEPGFRIFNPRRRKIGDAKFGANFGMLLAVDAAGVPVWYYRSDSRISDLERLDNGNFMYVTQDYRVVEIDMLGNQVAQWYASGRPLGKTEGVPIETLAVHHEVDQLPNGNILVLGVEMREIDNYYTSEYDADAPRKRQKVMGDEVIEFTRDGQEVWRWRAFDHLDPFRIGYETFSGYWNNRGFPDTVDWSHANGLMYDPADDSILVNFRYQAAAIKIDRKTKQIKWIIGEPGGWPDNLKDKVLKLEGDARWFYHQHAPHPTPHGTLFIFDNGNYRTRPFSPPLEPRETYSRAVEYAIDEASMSVEQKWVSEVPGPDTVLSFAMGDVDWLPRTGNVLVHYGMALPHDQLPLFNWRNVLQLNTYTRIREFTHTTPPKIVWELVLGNPAGESPVSWSLFGGDHLETLLPAPATD